MLTKEPELSEICVCLQESTDTLKSLTKEKQVCVFLVEGGIKMKQ